ncbi:hypothetical protein STENM327S_04561 [Streptomyces tendae]
MCDAAAPSPPQAPCPPDFSCCPPVTSPPRSRRSRSAGLGPRPRRTCAGELQARLRLNEYRPAPPGHRTRCPSRRVDQDQTDGGRRRPGVLPTSTGHDPEGTGSRSWSSDSDKTYRTVPGDDRELQRAVPASRATRRTSPGRPVTARTNSQNITGVWVVTLREGPTPTSSLLNHLTLPVGHRGPRPRTRRKTVARAYARHRAPIVSRRAGRPAPAAGTKANDLLAAGDKTGPRRRPPRPAALTAGRACDEHTQTTWSVSAAPGDRLRSAHAVRLARRRRRDHRGRLWVAEAADGCLPVTDARFGSVTHLSGLRMLIRAGCRGDRGPARHRPDRLDRRRHRGARRAAARARPGRPGRGDRGPRRRR